MLPTIQSVSKNASTHSCSKDGLRGHKEGLVQIHREMAAVVLLELETKVFDIDKQVDYPEGLSDTSDIMWLSSDSKSSSLLGSDDSQYIWEFDCCNLSLPDQFSSSLSLAESNDVLSDKGQDFLVSDDFTKSSTGEPLLVLNKVCEDTEGKSLKEELILQLHGTLRNKVKHSQIGHSESSDSSYEISLSENSSVTNSHCTSINTYEDTPSREFDRPDIWVSSLDLEGEDSELLQDKEQVFDIFDFDFPSPSFSTKWNLQSRPSICSSRSSIGQADEDKNTVEEPDWDEPLFWPFDHKSYWCPDFNNFLCLSPCKVGGIDGYLGPHEPKSIRSILHQKKTPAGRQVSQGCRSKFSPTTKSANTECKTRASDNHVQKAAASPSMWIKSTKTSYQHPCNISKKRRQPVLKISVPKHASGLETLKEVEAGNLQELVVEGVPIEKLVGLNEFDGYEGINVEFEQDNFTLYASPSTNMNVLLSGNTDWSMDICDHKGCNHRTMGINECHCKTEDCTVAHAKENEDILDEQLGEPHVHDGPMLSS